MNEIYTKQSDFVVTVTQDFGPDTKALELPHFSAAIVKWDVVESAPDEYYEDEIFIDDDEDEDSDDFKADVIPIDEDDFDEDDDATDIILTLQYRVNRAVSKEIQQAYPISDDADTVVTIACNLNGETQFRHVFRGDLRFVITMAADKNSDEAFLLTAKLVAYSAKINNIEDL